MKTALVYPYSKYSWTGCYPPISLLYLAASLQRAGKEVMVIDVDEGNYSFSDIRQRLIEYSPDLIGIPLFSNTLRAGYQIVKLLTDGNAKWEIVLGGAHATARPQQVLELFKGCRYVLRGEAETSIADLVNAIEKQRGLENINGLSYRQDDKIFHNPDVILEKNIDAIPFPARDLLDAAYKKNTYWRIGHRGAADSMITSRGCPFDCNFCFKITKKFRARSPESVLEEIMLIRSRGVKTIHILDDLFVAPKSRCLKILELIKEQKLTMEFKIRSRADLIDEELLSAMKDAGVKGVVYGIESGSQKILDLMNKRTDVETNHKAIRLTKKMGMQCYVDMIIGFPGETLGTIAETEKFLLMTKPTGVNLSTICPFPNTTVYDEAKEQGMLISDWEIDSPSPWIKLPWIESYDTLDECRKKMLRRYQYNPIVMANAFRAVLPGIDLKQLKLLIRYVGQLLS
jgi:anaerobic magnesium-protoporphyrin IX monomethyl ester cyclase